MISEKFCYDLGLDNILFLQYDVIEYHFFYAHTVLCCHSISILSTSLVVGLLSSRQQASPWTADGTSTTQNCFRYCLLNIFSNFF